MLAARPVALGLIEGVADAVASLIKLWSGRHSDIMSGRRKGLALAGYTLSNIARPLLGLAGSWPVILVLRSIDRVGKGLRSAPAMRWLRMRRRIGFLLKTARKPGPSLTKIA